MKKMRKESKKGFTLVELIVVLVILAVLAAMLVPALTGYIKRAREEKDYQAASQIYQATQAVVTDMYGRGAKYDSNAFVASDTANAKLYTITSAKSYQIGSNAAVTIMNAVADLAGIDPATIDDFSFDVNNKLVISGGWVKFNSGDAYYVLTIDSTSGAVTWTSTTTKPS